MTTARLKHEQFMDQWQNKKAESRYIAYLQLVEDVLENLAVMDHVVLRLRIKFLCKTSQR
jgi:hypothetical protein